MKERAVVFSEESLADLRRIFYWIADSSSSGIASGYVTGLLRNSSRIHEGDKW